MKRRTFITTVAFLGTSGIAGCGGDDGTETPTETTTAPETGTPNEDLGDPPAQLISLSICRGQQHHDPVQGAHEPPPV